jgi:putative restriction endonuclease
LESLLRDFGPQRQSYRPEYAFWHLESDGVWEVAADNEMTLRVLDRSPTRSELRRHHARGRFKPEVQAAFERDRGAIARVARRLLEAHFPETLHGDILSAVGLDLSEEDGIRGRGPGDQSGEATADGTMDSFEGGSDDREEVTLRRRPRDPAFRRRVLAAYEDRCAVCGLDLRLGPSPIGLEAAHIQWHQAGGPDEERNGLALCVLHHKVFDLGAFMVDEGLTLHVSDAVRGEAEGLGHALLRHHGVGIREPMHPEHRPAEAFLDWHREQVFKGKPRPAA